MNNWVDDVIHDVEHISELRDFYGSFDNVIGGINLNSSAYDCDAGAYDDEN